MKPQSSLILVPFLLAGCGGTSSSSPAPSSDASSEEPSSSVSSSESSASAPKEKIITLFDAESRFFLRDTKRDDTTGRPILKTYRHKYHGAIPYVDLQEFSEIYHSFDPDLKPRHFKVENGKYWVFRPDKGGIYFDAEKQTATIVDGDEFYGDLGVENGGVWGDVCQGVHIVHGSSKTRVLKKATNQTVALGDYRLDIVEEDGHLYVPFGVASHFFVEPYVCGTVYSGRDFYQSKCMLKGYNIVRARSRKGSFSWNADPGDGGGTGIGGNIAVMNPSDKAEGDAYCFQGTTEKGQSVTLHLKSDGTVEIESRITNLMMLDGTWKKEGEFLHVDFSSMSGADCPMEIDLGDRTLYNVGTRDAELARYNYALLCLSFDDLYGLKKWRNIDSFDAYFEKQGYKAGLTSTDTAVYDKTLSKFILYDIDDLHTTFVCPSLTGPGTFSPATDTSDTYFGPRDEAITSWRSKLGVLYSAAATQGTTDGRFTIRNATAVIRVSDYPFAYDEKGYASYQVPEGKTIQQAADSYFNESFFRGWAVCMNEILKHPEIKNVVFDLTENRGGYVYDLPIFSAIMDDDPRVIQANNHTGSETEFHYEVDLNGDHVFGGEGDTFKGKYRFAVLTSPASFSAGNITPSLAKSFGFATIMGLPSAGGPCPVAMRMDSFGYTFRTSAQIHYPCLVNGQYISNDQGVPVDLPFSENDFYNVAKIDQALNAYYQ